MRAICVHIDENAVCLRRILLRKSTAVAADVAPALNGWFFANIVTM